MNLRNVFVPRFIRFTRETEEWSAELIKVISASGKERPFLLFDEIFDRLDNFIPLRDKLISVYPSSPYSFTGTDEMDFSDSLTKSMIENHCDIVVALGGGKCLDMGKYSAFKAGLPFVSSPTQVSHDGICSPRAVLKLNASVFSLQARTPMAIIIDMDTIISAPERTTRAGIGDLVSNLVSVRDWQLGRDEKGEHYDDLAAMTASFAAEGIYTNYSADIKDEIFLERLIQGLVFSGVAMEIAGSSRPCSGADHKISHAIDQLKLGKGALHGEQVALGALVAMILQGMDWRRFRDFLQSAGLPVKCRDLKMKPDDFLRALEISCSIRPERYTILEKLNLDRKGYINRLEPAGILK